MNAIKSYLPPEVGTATQELARRIKFNPTKPITADIPTAVCLGRGNGRPFPDLS
jgi:hypothetical protein